jgi:hypothetical protein
MKTSRVMESNEGTPTNDTSQQKTEQTATGEDERGDPLVRGFWARGTDCMLLDLRVTDTDAESHCKRDPAKVLDTQEKKKKRKSLGACLERRRHFTPFVCSVDGLLGKEAKTFATSSYQGARQHKWEKLYSQVCGCVNARLSMAIVRPTHLCVRGSRAPVYKTSIRYPQWEDGL